MMPVSIVSSPGRLDVRSISDCSTTAKVHREHLRNRYHGPRMARKPRDHCVFMFHWWKGHMMMIRDFGESGQNRKGTEEGRVPSLN